jgi:decaprenyl-phosphate phosphoribosyltransferase
VTSTPYAAGRGGLAGAALAAARPKQWTKNVLVLAAPAAAGSLLDADVLRPTLVALVCFCLASASVYYVNDLLDREADRLHPLKRDRAIASGRLPAATAWVVAGVLAAASLGLAVLAGAAFVGLVAAYLGLVCLYSLWLKHEPVLDLAAVAGGFLLRAVAGGVAAQIPVSHWFLMVAGFGSLFIVAAKRYSEFQQLGGGAGTRRALARYSGSYLRFVWSMAAAATVIAYSLWAFEMAAASSGPPWHAWSVGAFVVGILRYAVDVDAGTAAEPEDIVLRDHVLQLVGLVWLVLVALGVQHG